MKRLIFILPFTFIVLLSLSLTAKNNVIVNIGKHEFTVEEYENIYRKNNSQLSDKNEVKSPEEYVDLFIDFKLKVIEAENRGMDTINAFKDELQGYRNELAQPYLTDVTFTEKMVQDAYYRITHPIHASHILFSVAPNAAPSDTLVAYNKAIEVRNMYLKGENSFADLAAKYSDDRSASQNKGDLGYFKAFSMVTSFENAAYNTPIGEVSLPARSQYGYHLIYVHDLSESKGRVKVAHIMKRFRDANNIDPETDKQLKQLCDSLYLELQNGADFVEMVKKHSDDQSTSTTNGEMQYIDETFRVTEFKNAAYELEQIGEIHKPIRSPFGWHIIKLLNKQAPPAFDEIEAELTQKVKTDPERSKHNKQLFISKLKNEYNFTAYDKNISELNNFIDNAGDTIKGFDKPNGNTILYAVNNQNYTVADFYKYLKNKSNTQNGISTMLAKKELEQYDETVILQFEDSQLEEKHPDFASIMQEYHDGMLLFSIMEEEVWDKAVKDSLGLEKFYENNSKTYFWDKHFDGLQLKCNTPQAAEYARKLLAENIEDPDSLYKHFNDNPSFAINITKGKWEEGDNPTVDYFYFDGEKPQNFKAETHFMHGRLVEAGNPKTLDDARGLYISDYQNYLEKEWLKSLRNKYEIKINKRLFKKIKSL